MKQLILDTDLGSDCDDVGALAVLYALAQLGEVSIRAIAHANGLPNGTRAIGLLNAYYRQSVPVAHAWNRRRHARAQYDEYATKLCGLFPDSAPPKGQRLPDAVSLLRRTLAEAADRVTLVAIGPLSNLAALLDSPPDRYSRLSGCQLLEAHAAELVLMGGYFDRSRNLLEGDLPYPAEFNITCDIPAAQAVFDRWPGSIVASPFEVGYELVTGQFLANPAEPADPLACCYRDYCGGKGRYSWDLTAVLYAVRGAGQDWAVSAPGSIVVDRHGVTDFVPSPTGRHRYLTGNLQAQVTCATLDALLRAGRRLQQ
ncbi:MAG: nucleoside hydrolase [Angelakisella sp.]